MAEEVIKIPLTKTHSLEVRDHYRSPNDIRIMEKIGSATLASVVIPRVAIPALIEALELFHKPNVLT